MRYHLRGYPLGFTPQKMFWVLINPIQRDPKTKNWLMVENLFRFNIKLVLGPGLPQRVSLKVKYWYSIKCVTKIMKFVANFAKSVLGY